MNDAALEPRSDWQEDKDMPLRQWIVPGYLLRGSVTIIGGPGGAGKSSLMIGWCAALALGMTYHRFAPPGIRKVIFYNVEDDLDEQNRRLCAVLRQFNKTTHDLGKNFLALCPRQIGTLLDVDKDHGLWQPTNVMIKLEEHICLFAPDVLILDPLVELHNTEENAQSAMRAVIAYFRTLAQRYGIAIVILHHTRKDSGESAGDPDILRGASSTVAAARVAFTALPMTEKEAENLNISNDMRRHFFRVDSAKTNYAPASAAEWFELAEYILDNGETVAAAIPWIPPADHALDASEHDALSEEIAQGIHGMPYSARLSTHEPRSLLHLLIRHGIKTKKGQKDMIYKLLANGFDLGTFIDQRTRNKSKGFRFKDGRPAAHWTENFE